MLVQLLDAQGIPHWVTWQGQDQVNDYSGSLGAGAVGLDPEFQEVAPANPGPPPAGRAGWLFQNTSQNPMLLNELGDDAVVTNSWIISPGEAFPPAGYPIPAGAIMVVGSGTSVEGDSFVYREWINAFAE